MLYCPKCAGETEVRRSFDDVRSISRLRVCKACSYRFTTVERISIDVEKAFTHFLKILPEKVQKEPQA